MDCLMTRKRGVLPCYRLHRGDFDSKELSIYINLFSVDTVSKGGVMIFLFLVGKVSLKVSLSMSQRPCTTRG